MKKFKTEKFDALTVVSEFYGVFYKRNGKWKPFCKNEFEMFTLKQILKQNDSIDSFLKEYRMRIKRPVKLMREMWIG